MPFEISTDYNFVKGTLRIDKLNGELIFKYSEKITNGDATDYKPPKEARFSGSAALAAFLEEHFGW